MKMGLVLTSGSGKEIAYAYRGAMKGVVYLLHKVVSFLKVLACAMQIQKLLLASKKGGERQFNGLIDVYKKTLPWDNFFASFALGWLITNGVGLASYPIDMTQCEEE
ncbi:putative ADP/ATP carrier protein, eukaryotic type [Helianthus annuus]|nr:putative ADP/ATP carrier protein, eukaryotic type [Helianthus annuus]